MEGCYRLATALGRAGIRALAIDVRWTGIEHLPLEGPALLASNHVSYPDFVFVQRAAAARGRDVRFMCRHDVWHGRVLSWAMDQMRHIPVDRQAPAYAYLKARHLLSEGEAVCAFPEAGISYSFTVRPLMRGVVSLARESGVPIIPVALWGSQRIHTVGDPEPPPDFTRGRRVDVAFGAPLYVDHDADLVIETQALGHRLTEMLESLQVLAHHRPRPGEVAEWYPAHLGGQAPTREQAAELDIVPSSAVRQTWGPDPRVNR